MQRAIQALSPPLRVPVALLTLPLVIAWRLVHAVRVSQFKSILLIVVLVPVILGVLLSRPWVSRRERYREAQEFYVNRIAWKYVEGDVEGANRYILDAQRNRVSVPETAVCAKLDTLTDGWILLGHVSRAMVGRCDSLPRTPVGLLSQ
jgi:hypothetical protein